MTEVAPVTLRRLHTQGFGAVDPAWLAEVSPWLRLSPALCAGFATLGTVLASPAVLALLALTALLGAMLPLHPFDLIYNYRVRFVLGKRPLPPNGAPRRFACGIASVWLAATAVLFAAGNLPAGYALGALFVAVAALVATTDICIPSHVYHVLCRHGGAAPKPR
jgi:Domain of unknown function (DUF4395)